MKIIKKIELALLLVFCIGLFLPAQAQKTPQVEIWITLSALDEYATVEKLETTRQIIEKRLHEMKYSDGVVQLGGNNQITVIFKVEGDLEEALDPLQDVLFTIQHTGLLEFVELSNLMNLPEIGDCIITTAQLDKFSTFEQECSFSETSEPYSTVLTGAMLEDAMAAPSSAGSSRWEVAFSLSDEGSAIFGEFTGTHIGQALAIVLDGNVISAPIIQAKISQEGIITGNFTSAEAEALAVQLRYGALPVKLRVISVNLNNLVE